MIKYNKNINKDNFSNKIIGRSVYRDTLNKDPKIYFAPPTVTFSLFDFSAADGEYELYDQFRAGDEPSEMVISAFSVSDSAATFTISLEEAKEGTSQAVSCESTTGKTFTIKPVNSIDENGGVSVIKVEYSGKTAVDSNGNILYKKDEDGNYLDANNNIVDNPTVMLNEVLSGVNYWRCYTTRRNSTNFDLKKNEYVTFAKKGLTGGEVKNTLFSLDTYLDPSKIEFSGITLNDTTPTITSSKTNNVSYNTVEYTYSNEDTVVSGIPVTVLFKGDAYFKKNQTSALLTIAPTPISAFCIGDEDVTSDGKSLFDTNRTLLTNISKFNIPYQVLTTGIETENEQQEVVPDNQLKLVIDSGEKYLNTAPKLENGTISFDIKNKYECPISIRFHLETTTIDDVKDGEQVVEFTRSLTHTILFSKILS